jgi:hypothetical protein
MKPLFKCLGLASVLCLMTLACTSESTQTDPQDLKALSEKASQEDYEKVLTQYSGGDVDYNGFYNTFGFHVAILNSELIDARIKRQAFYYMWDQGRIDSEKDKSFKKASESTDIFLSFYTPDRHDDNLTTDKSIWRVLLDAGGKRYVGKIKKLKEPLTELATLYPFHTRWNTPYLVSFPIPTSQAETQTSKLTITGPLGSRSIDFPAK